MTYSYDPAKLAEYGKDRMRFELGDTLTDGGADTCALSDEEYDGVLRGVAPDSRLPIGKKAWMYAKLYALEAITLKLSYQTNTRIDVLQYDLGDRAGHFRKLYEQLRRQILLSYGGLPSISPHMESSSSYFHTGMEENERCAYPDNVSFRRMTRVTT